MSFKGKSHAYLLSVATTQNKKQTLLLNLLIQCISARLAPHILPLKDKHVFPIPDFLQLIVGLE